jgi:hypothetical protein
MKFFVGLHHPCDAGKFARSMISFAAIRKRKSCFPVNDWILDSGAFMELKQHGRYRDEPENYATQVNRWSECGNLLAAVSQDYMCEPFIREITGLSTREHQRMTVERYDRIRAATEVYVMPVLQGFWPDEYVQHIRDYGSRLSDGMWVGVGSVCKRNALVNEIEAVLEAVRVARPDLKLHGFGVKTTALASSVVRRCLYSADSMAWSFAARKEGRDGNSWLEAKAFVQRIEGQLIKQRVFQRSLPWHLNQ